MLRRLRGARAADPSSSTASAAEASGGHAHGSSTAGVARVTTAVAALTPPAATANAKPLTLDEQAAMLPDTLVAVVPGIAMPFSRQELGRIKQRFVALQPRDALPPTPMSISITACASMPEFAGARFAEPLMRVAAAPSAIESVDNIIVSPRRAGPSAAPDRLAFDGFLTTLSVLSVKQRVAVKRLVLFRIYDTDRDGVVSIDDFVAALLAATSALSRAELKAALATQFPVWASRPGATQLSAEAFQALFSDADVHAALTVAF